MEDGWFNCLVFMERYNALFLTEKNTFVKGWFTINYDKESNNQGMVTVNTTAHPYIKSVAQMGQVAILVEDAIGRWPRPK